MNNLNLNVPFVSKMQFKKKKKKNQTIEKFGGGKKITLSFGK